MTGQPSVQSGAASGSEAALAGLRGAREQLAQVITMLEQGQSREEVVTGLVAVSKALSRAGFTIIASGLRNCAAADPQTQGCSQELTADELVALFLRLA